MKIYIFIILGLALFMHILNFGVAISEENTTDFIARLIGIILYGLAFIFMFYI